MKKMQALYNDNANKIVKHATKNVLKNINFLIGLTVVSSNTKPNLEEP